MSAVGRTVWQAQDAGWWRRERVVMLGVTFGSEGPSIANWLECEAKAQNAGGLVKAGYLTAARGAFIADGDERRAREIVAFAVEIGFLKDFEERTHTFTAAIAAYKADQESARAALRQRAKREREHLEYDDVPPVGDALAEDSARTGPSPPVTAGHSASPPVTAGNDLRGEERTEELKETSSPVEPGRLDAARERAESAQRLFAYWQQQCDHPTARFTKDRRSKVEARLREGFTEAQIRRAIDGAARAAFVNDQGKRFDDLELICRHGSKLEDFIGRADGPGPAGAAGARPHGPAPRGPAGDPAYQAERELRDLALRGSQGDTEAQAEYDRRTALGDAA